MTVDSLHGKKVIGKNFTDKRPFPGFVSSGKESSVTLCTFFGITHQVGVWSPVCTDELGLHLLVFPL